MKRQLLWTCCISAVAFTAVAAPTNPYSGQQDREIKALPAEEVQSYLSGKGMGLAKSAELNGYPGPSHVLALATELGLTADQQKATKALFASMEASAIQSGRLLVEEERRLDALFATKQVTPELMQASLSQIGALQAQVRAAHLMAHIEQSKLLTPKQTARYNELRGYASASSPGHTGHHR